MEGLDVLDGRGLASRSKTRQNAWKPSRAPITKGVVLRRLLGRRRRDRNRSLFVLRLLRWSGAYAAPPPRRLVLRPGGLVLRPGGHPGAASSPRRQPQGIRAPPPNGFYTTMGRSDRRAAPRSMTESTVAAAGSKPRFPTRQIRARPSTRHLPQQTSALILRRTPGDGDRASSC